MNLMKTLKMEPVACGHITMYEGRLLPGVIARIVKLAADQWRAVIEDNNDPAIYNTFELRRDALTFINEYKEKAA